MSGTRFHELGLCQTFQLALNVCNTSHISEGVIVYQDDLLVRHSSQLPNLVVQTPGNVKDSVYLGHIVKPYPQQELRVKAVLGVKSKPF